MAVLSPPTGSDAWEGVVALRGAGDVLAAQAAELPQPDQLCGPFAAHAALHAVLEPGQVPGLERLALAAGTRVHASDDGGAGERPGGTAPDRRGWDRLPTAVTPSASGTDAADLAAGVIAATGGSVAVVPARGAVPGAWSATDCRGLLADLARADHPVGVVANVWTAPMLPAEHAGWDVGHFVVLWGLDEDGGRVAVADSYAELTGPGAPPGCRLVDAAALGEGLGGGAGRGLLLLVAPQDAVLVGELAVAHGTVLETWRT